jgi:predicted nucleic acid-binding protein
MVVTERPWLIDKSALVRLGDCQELQMWAERIERSLVHITTITLLETGYSARSTADMGELMDRPPLSLMPVEYLTPAAEKRAVEVQRRLAELGQHRAPSIPDLLIAATAETARLTVLHVDTDFDLIAEITGQETHRLQ